MLAEPKIKHIHISINIRRHNFKLNYRGQFVPLTLNIYISGLPTSIFMGYFVEMRAGSGKEVHK
jgi:hypothetical protein